MRSAWEMAAINVRCLDDADADTFRVRKVDGKSFLALQADSP